MLAICLGGLTPTGVAAESTPNAAAPLQLAMFRGDITPPVGEGACIGFMPKVVTVEHPLEARGIILRRGGDTWALVALDYQGLCNSSDDLFRSRMAEAIGTTPDCVAIQSLHQHTAPALDLDAAELLYADQPQLLAAHRELCERMSARVAESAKKALSVLQPVTRVVGSMARVDRVASNRRVPQPDGSLAVRGSATRDAELRAASEGLIDPWLRTVTFFNADKPLAQLHYYATHPQSFYGDERISWDVPGIARQQFERETGVFQIYFTGCGGNVAMGKYNRGTRQDRAALADRLLDAMRRATSDQVTDSIDVDLTTLPAKEIDWSTTPLRFTPREEPEFRDETLLAQLAADLPLSHRIKPAMYLAWSRRMRSGHAATVSRLRIGPLQIVHLPGEPFVEFQLFAQKAAGDNSFVCVAGYGECGVWYFGPDSIFHDRGGYEQSWSFTAPCQREVETALTNLLSPFTVQE